MKVKLTSWNVNGIRAVLKKGFMDFFNESKSDILCIQETKARPEQVDIELPGYNDFWNSAEKKGYSGTAIFSKIKPFEITNGIGIEKHDNEGRVITADYDKLVQKTTGSKFKFKLVDLSVAEGAFHNYAKKLNSF